MPHTSTPTLRRHGVPGSMRSYSLGNYHAAVQRDNTVAVLNQVTNTLSAIWDVGQT